MMALKDDCLFCKIIKGEIPCDKVYEDEHVLAFNDISPVSPFHILVIPKSHYSSINDFEEQDKELLGHLMLAAKKVAKQVGIDQKGFRLIINTGEDGGQTVNHIHVHILGGEKQTWPHGRDAK